jgi:hypothetical protein
MANPASVYCVCLAFYAAIFREQWRVYMNGDVPFGPAQDENQEISRAYFH